MNLQTINDYVVSFHEQVTASGFLRDVTDFNASIQNNSDNIVSLRSIAEKLLLTLEAIHAGDLPEALKHLFPDKKIKPFTAARYDDQLQALLNDKTVLQDAFFAQLQTILRNLLADLKANATEVDRVQEFIRPYVAAQGRQLSAVEKAVFSIIFRDHKTISGLSEFSRTLALWNKVLPLYHQLVCDTSPPEIEIVEVQNGSIDLVLNLDVKVALDLTTLFKIGFTAYAAYLAHKKNLLPITLAYFGNERLLDLDRKKDQVLLENIGEAVSAEAKKQYQENTQSKSQVDNPDKIIEQVTRLVTSHLVRGNDVKLLALPASASTPSKGNENGKSPEQIELQKASVEARSALRGLPLDATTLLLEEYKNYEEEAMPSSTKKIPKKSVHPHDET